MFQLKELGVVIKNYLYIERSRIVSVFFFLIRKIKSTFLFLYRLHPSMSDHKLTKSYETTVTASSYDETNKLEQTSNLKDEDNYYGIVIMEAHNDLEAVTNSAAVDELFVTRARRMHPVRKYIITGLLALCAFQVTCLSTVWSQAIPDVAEIHNISKTVATLGVTLFIVGQGAGPLAFSPLSERYGRKPVYLVGLALYCLFQLLTCLGTHLAAMLIGRFFSGLSGGVFLTVISGTFSDMFDREAMGIPTLIFSIAPFLGPGVGPIIGGSISVAFGYRWIFIVMLLWSTLLLILVGLLVPETSARALGAKLDRTKRKAAEKATGEVTPLSVKIRTACINTGQTIVVIAKSPRKPLTMLATDLIIFSTSLLSGVFLATIYLFFVAFPLIFEGLYRMTPLATSATYLCITAGMLLTVPTFPFWAHVYARLVRAADGVEQPEHWLPQMLTGTIFAAIGLLIFALTIGRNSSIVGPLVAAGIFGFGALHVFNSVFSYVFASTPADSTASAAACNLFCRSSMAGVFPLFGQALFTSRELGLRGACFLLAGIVAALSSVPIGLYFYGPKLREKRAY
jgi:multidrug resistance protein